MALTLREREACAHIAEELAQRRWLAVDDAGADTSGQVAVFIHLGGLLE